MAYLGKSALRASNIKRWTGTPANNATEITFSTLGFTPLNEQSTHISINGVVQHDSAYTLSATAIVFTDSFDGVDEVEVTGILSVGQPIVPADNSVALIHLSPSLEATINSHLPNTGGSLTGNLDITGNLIISGTVDGRDVATDGTKLDGVGIGDGNLYVPATTTSNNGKFLKAGSTAGSLSWDTVDALPSQSGNSGKFLKTVSNTATWAALDTDANTTTKPLYEHSNTISSNYTITAGNNAMTAGPITIDAGVYIEIPATSTWVVV